MRIAPRCAALLLSLLACGAMPLAVDEERLDRVVIPTFEAVRLELDPSTDAYRGEVDIDLEVSRPVRSFRFHARDMDLREVTLDPGGASGAGVPLRHEAGRIGLVTVTADSPIAAGQHRLHIAFTNDLDRRATGLYRVDADGRGYAFTQFEADDARGAFPCFDEPGFKNPWQLTLVVPGDQTAITNTPVESETVAQGRRTMIFARTRPLPSYLIAIAAGPLESIPIPGLPIPGRIVTVKGRSVLGATAASLTPPLLAALESYFGSSYPFEKLDLIAVPEFWPGAMENPGAITFAESILLVDPERITPGRRAGIAGITAHELAHIWFGDMVTMAWWDDLWLNESFADWMGDKITQQVFPELETDLNEIEGVEAIMRSDARPASFAIRRPVAAADDKLRTVGTAYNKGKTVLRMFEEWMGPDVFRRGVVDHLKQHAWGTATSSDLWSALGRASGKDVEGVMAGFLDQSGIPLVTVEPLPAGRVRLSQRRYLAQGISAEPRAWRIPVTLKFPDGATTRTLPVLLAEPSTTVTLGLPDAPAWIHPDAGATGYYRWSLPREQLESLPSHAGAALSLRERIAFLGNLLALMEAGEVEAGTYLKLVEGAAADPRPEVAAAALGALGAVRLPLVADEARDLFSRYVRAVLGPALDRVGLEPRAGESAAASRLRPRLWEWLGMRGDDPRVRDRASQLARACLDDCAAVPPDLAGVSLAVAARDADRAMFDALKKSFEAARVPDERMRYLTALGSVRDPALSEEALAYTLTGPLRAREIFAVGTARGDSEAGRERLFRFVTENFDALMKRLPAQSAGFMPRFAGGCEPSRVEAARDFFMQPQHVAPGTEATLAIVEEEVADCVRLRRREAGHLEAYILGRTTGGMP
jgi:cytosol alanyl aminopeptidase